MKSENCSNSRYSYTSYGSRVSVDLKVVPNAEVPVREHYRSMSARTSDSIMKMKSLHVPTRRENFNSHVSLQLGTDTNQMNRTTYTSHERKHYPVVTRHDNTKLSTLNVNDPQSSQAWNDPKHQTVQENFYAKSLESPNKNAS